MTFEGDFTSGAATGDLILNDGSSKIQGEMRMHFTRGF